MDVSQILCPISGREASHDALPVAASAAKRLGVPLTLFSAVENPRDIGPRRAELDFMCEQEGVTVSIEVVAAPHPPTAIVAFAEQDALVVMATTTRQHLLSGYIGSATEHVIRSTHRPVMTVGPNVSVALDDVTGVVVPCDGSELSEDAVPVGQMWATALGVDLTVVAMIDPSATGPAESNYVHRIADSIDAQWDVLHGDDPAESITNFASGQLIAMTTHGRSGFDRLRLGSVVTETTRLTNAPLIALCPTP